jgi:hypothetical protein
MSKTQSALMLLLTVAVVTCSPVSTSNSPAPSATGKLPAIAGCVGLQPSANEPVANCEVRAGALIYGVDCSKSQVMSPDLVGLTGDTNATSTEIPIPIKNGMCALVATSQGQVTRIVGRYEAPADVVAVADFVPRVGGVLSLDVRCGEAACVGMKIRMPDELHITEVASGRTGELYSTTTLLSVDKEYRAVIAITGSQLKGWLNGVPTDGVTTADVSPGFVTVSIYDESGGMAHVDVVRFFTYSVPVHS